ncbi:4Fe-4S ferredoxin N-terminal domain-containing protein [Natronobacterium gregoryi]|uniref:4Fe-4S ferredoxin iron-sulfur binding domain-containing protein n=2 Tax=Natronobacterium gregoryi TaxID=44930 RepID=L9YBT2_NATGS|nr:4Fe-4S ferredoxin N-terminal domain-containing protein [Natronobacterium gregoryi]ELY71505.1 hypothetical protein C490_04977 [Natronobacterium gregoryi SP2]PLK18053.1 hypothetical protein CYV19_18785 [Natronobacterium gregoryi SP2]SFJ00966.1 prokaryotic molybdopterin-containing oxidoreductase family, iron-sulfur binding subunit [Natronobacterium gregoryi]
MSDVDETQQIEDDAVGIDAGEWEETADEILAASPYDTTLGKQMSRDAVRVSNGDLSEEQFHEKYHDAVVAEFGVDERPSKSGDDE